jgi:hypothetical protein
MMKHQKFIALAGVTLLSASLLPGCARQETAPRVGNAEVQKQTPATLKDLQPGQPISYYVSQFEKMGYSVKNSDYQTDKAIYELSEGKNVEEVTLSHDPEQNLVTQVDTRHLGWFTEGREEKNIAADKFRQDVEKLATGKPAEDYVAMLDKYGTVTEYKLHRDDAVVEVTSDKNRYKVRLDVDPKTRVVTDISLENGILNMEG